mmetsp:Transcript_16978/g.46965  ORF Transcript_16978/g.46965 Transcript_16978/m.46965 type:complete len:536 (-) Transcript_16978:704-2311(-)
MSVGGVVRPEKEGAGLGVEPIMPPKPGALKGLEGLGRGEPPNIEVVPAPVAAGGVDTKPPGCGVEAGGAPNAGAPLLLGTASKIGTALEAAAPKAEGVPGAAPKAGVLELGALKEGALAAGAKGFGFAPKVKGLEALTAGGAVGVPKGFVAVGGCCCCCCVAPKVKAGVLAGAPPNAGVELAAPKTGVEPGAPNEGMLPLGAAGVLAAAGAGLAPKEKVLAAPKAGAGVLAGAPPKACDELAVPNAGAGALAVVGAKAEVPKVGIELLPNANPEVLAAPPPPAALPKLKGAGCCCCSCCCWGVDVRLMSGEAAGGAEAADAPSGCCAEAAPPAPKLNPKGDLLKEGAAAESAAGGGVAPKVKTGEGAAGVELGAAAAGALEGAAPNVKEGAAAPTPLLAAVDAEGAGALEAASAAVLAPNVKVGTGEGAAAVVLAAGVLLAAGAPKEKTGDEAGGAIVVEGAGRGEPKVKAGEGVAAAGCLAFSTSCATAALAALSACCAFWRNARSQPPAAGGVGCLAFSTSCAMAAVAALSAC